MGDRSNNTWPWHKLSIIVPALNEEQNIGRTIERLQRGCVSGRSELIVVDGGSQDNTRAVAAAQGAQVVCSGRGRGVQQNKGLEAASGDWCLFVHADTQLPDQYDLLMAEAISHHESQARKPAEWGCFQSIQATGLRPLQQWMLQAGVALRTRWAHAPYGDQAIFAKAGTLRSMGGFKDWPMLEDVELVERLKRACGPPAIVGQHVVTSGRRWQKLGFWRNTLMNQAVLLRWRMGADVQQLASWYQGAGRA